MKTVQITEDAVLKAHNEASNKGKTLLENLFSSSVFKKDIKERLQGFDDALNELGDDDPDVLDYVKLQKAGVSDHILAGQELAILVKAYNEKKVPDYNDQNQRKYEPYFKISSSGVGFSFNGYVSWFTDSIVGSRLAFLNYDNMKDAVKKFLPVYKRWAQQ